MFRRTTHFLQSNSRFCIDPLHFRMFPDTFGHRMVKQRLHLNKTEMLLSLLRNLPLPKYWGRSRRFEKRSVLVERFATLEVLRSVVTTVNVLKSLPFHPFFVVSSPTDIIARSLVTFASVVSCAVRCIVVISALGVVPPLVIVASIRYNLMTDSRPRRKRSRILSIWPGIVSCRFSSILSQTFAFEHTVPYFTAICAYDSLRAIWTNMSFLATTMANSLGTL